ncbi:MAG: ankyrin repeat domain-containing protein [Verrucomicrobiota bacterium]
MRIARQSPAGRCFRALILALWAIVVPPLRAGEAPLAAAAERGDAASLRQLLRRKPDVQAAQPDGMTALHWAARRDDLDSASRLLRAKAAVDATNRYGVTPLAIACENGSGPMVRLLLAHRANPNGSLRGGETALMTAARTGRPEPVQALLERGADVHARERRGQTALMWAAAEGHEAAVRMLLQAGADAQASLPDSGFTPFLLAVREGRAGVARILLDAGVDVRAAVEPRRAPAKGLRRGTAALLLAVENGHFELALDLVRAGADPNDQRSGYTPLHVLTWVRKPQRGEDDGDPPPAGSGRLNSVQFIRELVKLGADVNARLREGRGGPGLYHTTGATPFLMAAGTADLEYLKLLVELGADPSISNTDRCTPLMAACGIGVGAAAANEVAGEEAEVLEVAEHLLGLGADVNAVDANGETAMHGAALKNLPRVVRFLADHGARAEIWHRKNRQGWTPLLLAQGHRPGNFKPSFETIDAVERVMRAAGLEPDAPPARPPAGPDYPPGR